MDIETFNQATNIFINQMFPIGFGFGFLIGAISCLIGYTIHTVYNILKK